MTLKTAIEKGMVVEIESDLYLTEDGRVLKYDRYFKKNPRRASVCNMWVDDEGNVFHNFENAYDCASAYRWA